MNCQTLVHEIRRDQPKTTKVILDHQKLPRHLRAAQQLLGFDGLPTEAGRIPTGLHLVLLSKVS
jgi:hypothetical protein